jgi:hypothetical protein
LFCSPIEQIDNGKVEIGHIAILTMALVKLLEPIAAGFELAIIKKRTG